MGKPIELEEWPDGCAVTVRMDLMRYEGEITDPRGNVGPTRTGVTRAGLADALMGWARDDLAGFNSWAERRPGRIRQAHRGLVLGITASLEAAEDPPDLRVIEGGDRE
jgi:hypothetical protein